MILKLDDKKKVNIFYKLLPFYRSFLFYGVNFKTNNEDEQIKIIINGLNIKNRRKRIVFVYDETCKFIDRYYKGKNVCGFIGGKCYSQQCIKKDYYNGCCRRCRYQSDVGCMTSNVACKLFMCSEVCKRYDVLTIDDVKILKLLSLKNQFLIRSDFFSKREDVLNDLYTYTLSLATIRVVYRLIKDMFYVNKLTKK